MLKSKKIYAAAVLAALIALPRMSWAESGCRTGPCHRTIGQEPFAHDPVHDKGCLVCHDGSADNHPAGEGREFGPSAAQVKRLCLTCHDKLAARLQGARSTHRPVELGECLACHLPHGAERRSLLRQPFPEDSSTGLPERIDFELSRYSLCWDCHEPYLVMLEKTSGKTAFRDGTLNLHATHVKSSKGYTCRACHLMHASGYEKLIGRYLSWTENLIEYSATPTGGTCATACHTTRSYDRESPPVKR